MFAVARVYLATHENEKVLEYAQNGQAICKTIGWKHGEAEALQIATRAHANMENLDAALESVIAAKDVLKLIGDQTGEASMLAMAAEVQMLREEFEAAMQFSKEVAEI